LTVLFIPKCGGVAVIAKEALYLLYCMFFFVAPLLDYLSKTDGVRAVYGFCDDWELSIAGLRPLRRVRQVIEDFESASGQCVHRTKSKFLPSRRMSTTEKQMLRSIWPDACIVEKAEVLGTWIGASVTISDFLRKPLAAFLTRLQAYRNLRMSLAMRIFVSNVYLLPLFSYVARILVLPADVVRNIENHILRFVTPITFCKLEVFCHLRSFMRCKTQLRDVHLDNIAAILATTARLQIAGTFAQRSFDSWRVLADSGDPRAFDISGLRPMSHAACAYYIFRSYTGQTIDAIDNDFDLSTACIRPPKLQNRIYARLLKSQWLKVLSGLRSRWVARGLDSDRIIDNLQRLPSCVTTAHRFLLLRLLLNGVFTSNRLRFVIIQDATACPFCNTEGADTITHWAQCDFIHALARSIYPVEVDVLVSSECIFLQGVFNGSDLQRSCAFWFGISRMRNLIVRGFRHHTFADAVRHLRSLLDDPWLTGNPSQESRVQRRASRLRRPADRVGFAIYYSDGAARANGEEDRISSFGVLLRLNDAIVARFAGHLGSVSNNVAEYEGVVHALSHASRHARSHMVFRVDSLLVARQLQGTWACHSPICYLFMAVRYNYWTPLEALHSQSR